MGSWFVYSLAFAGVLLSACTNRRTSPHWYLSTVPSLLYGGVVAWMFLEENPLLALRIILFGALLPVALLLWVWRGGQERHSTPGEPSEK